MRKEIQFAEIDIGIKKIIDDFMKEEWGRPVFKYIESLLAEIEQIKMERGAESESLRVEFEQMSRRNGVIEPEEITEVLDRIDAGESLEYLDRYNSSKNDVKILVKRVEVLAEERHELNEYSAVAKKLVDYIWNIRDDFDYDREIVRLAGEVRKKEIK